MLTNPEKNFLIYCLKVKPYFYRNKLTKCQRMIDEGYLKVNKTFCGPLKTPDPAIVVLTLTESGRTIAESLATPS